MAATEDFDVETIAAFIDGRLKGAERERAVKLLRESEAAFEVYADALRIRADLGGAEVISIATAARRRDRRWLVAVPAVAAAMLMVAVMPRIQAAREGATLEAPVATIALPLLAVRANLPAQSAEHKWTVTRGGGTALVESTTVFRLGVRVADLHVAVATGERERAGRLTGDVIELLQPVDLSDGVRADYADLRSRIKSRQSTREILVASDSAELKLDRFLGSRWFGIGKWFGTGEIAASARSVDFFTSPNTARFLGWATKPGHLAPNDVETLREVAMLSGKPVSDADFEAIRQAFAELIRRHGE